MTCKERKLMSFSNITFSYQSVILFISKFLCCHNHYSLILFFLCVKSAHKVFSHLINGRHGWCNVLPNDISRNLKIVITLSLCIRQTYSTQHNGDSFLRRMFMLDKYSQLRLGVKLNLGLATGLKLFKSLLMFVRDLVSIK